MKCPSCGTLNYDAALSCTLCGWVINRDGPKEGSLVDERRVEEAPVASAHLIQLEAARLRARMFLVLIGVQVVLLALLGLGLFSILNEDLIGIHGEAGMATGLVAGLLLMLNFTMAFLTAKTGTLMGMPFWFNFLLSFILPAVPGIWARVAGRNILYVYGWLLLDILVLAGFWNSFGPTSPVMQTVFLVMLPVLMYHALGCAVPTVASALGLNHYLTVLWLCLGPLGILTIWVYHVFVPGGWYARMSELGQGTESAVRLLWELAPSFWGSSTVLGAVLIYVGCVLAVWIHTLHLNLKYPVI